MEKTANGSDRITTGLAHDRYYRIEPTRLLTQYLPRAAALIEALYLAGYSPKKDFNNTLQNASQISKESKAALQTVDSIISILQQIRERESK